jgi:rhodanese-related sulfurtransferase
MEEVKQNNYTTEAIPNISPREAFNLSRQGAIILDVREDYYNQYKKFDAPEVIQISSSRLKDEYQKLPTDRLIIIADTSGLKSKEAALLLYQKKFSHLSNLAGGLVEWEREGLPIVIDNTERMTGSCACQLRKRDKGKNN